MEHTVVLFCVSSYCFSWGWWFVLLLHWCD